MATHASRDTTTGKKFEEKIHIGGKGIDLSQEELRYYFEKNFPHLLFSLSHINQWKRDREKFLNGAEVVVSKELKPDEAYFNPEELTLKIYEKKTQNGGGSADEKLQTCAFKIVEYRKIAKYLGVPPENVTYTYILDEWFKDPKYKDALEFVKMTNGCDYMFVEEV